MSLTFASELCELGFSQGLDNNPGQFTTHHVLVTEVLNRVFDDFNEVIVGGAVDGVAHSI